MSAAIEPTSWIVVAVFLVTIIGVAYELKTRKGSGINEHPGPDPEADDDMPDPTQRADSSPLDQRGKK